MEKAESMYGVTMQETGVSSLVGVEMDSLPV
jgi:chromosome segregation ATPase